MLHHTHCFFHRAGFISAFVLLISVLPSCKNPTPKPEAKEIVAKPEDIDQKTGEIIAQALQYAYDNSGKIDDSITLRQYAIAKYIYSHEGEKGLWSQQEHWTSLGDSLYNFIKQSKLYGLFPEDYHIGRLSSIRTRVAGDSVDRKDAALWARADVMLTDAFVQLLNDIKLGRLPNDSVSQRTDSVLSQEFFQQQITDLLKPGSITQIAQSLEPANPYYQALKAAIPGFLDSADFRHHTPVIFPTKDTAAFKLSLLKRLSEEDSLITDSTFYSDSIHLAKYILKYQKRKGLTADGKFGKQVLNSLNTSDSDRFVSIAISLDRYKLLPPVMPEKYIWVNLPGYYLQLRVADSVKIQSKIICGKPLTRTPLLTSSISNMVTYPQWTIPESIILKEVLPGLKKDTNYLAKKGYVLIDKNEQEVNPATVNWAKYNKGIPYKVIQGSGDDNALGILKFNFNNKYAVYLHDTNQRYLFSRDTRSLSHGCVRVQSWEKLAFYIMANDSISAVKADSIKPKFIPSDTLRAWLLRKEKHTLPVKNRIPLFIRYITCEGRDGKVVFYDDIYGEDKILRKKYFAGK
ncbi:MAG: L,D-transpeptidase family protein [Bacteroidetes bacterium]|nr:L,D-transpeptidase family protein [Bacteroidota bacterium]